MLAVAVIAVFAIHRPLLLVEQVIQILLRDDEANERKRVAIVTYADNESASACQNKMDGLIVADNILAARESGREKHEWGVTTVMRG